MSQQLIPLPIFVFQSWTPVTVNQLQYILLSNGRW